MAYTISDFWKKRLPAKPPSSFKNLRGWSSDLQGLESFMEAPLTLSQDFGNKNDPENSPLILVSAPGAVGKSTLARQIASVTGATYIDLAEAEPVGGYTLSGGLLKSNIYNDWQGGAAAVLIDGLDEARLKVTQEGFEAFLSDICDVCSSRSIPTVLFGRTGAIQDVWLYLEDKLPVVVLEIGFYEPEVALNFAVKRLEALAPSHQHIDTCRDALSILLNRLRSDTVGDGNRFAGYAPVLEAVARRVAEETNVKGLISQINKGDQPVTLQTVVDAILEREHQKLASVPLEDNDLSKKLYNKEEQLNRLVAHVFNLTPPGLPPMSTKDTQAYSNVLKTWVPEHPFLDGGRKAAAAVFEAVVISAALTNSDACAKALKKELTKGAAANPFLSEFYLSSIKGNLIPAEQIGIVYASLRARLSLGDTASLLIEGVDDVDELEGLRANVEISISRAGDDQTKTTRLETQQIGVFYLGGQVEDVEIIAPKGTVEIGGSREAVMITPVSIQCKKIQFSTERLIIEKGAGGVEGSVFLEAESTDATSIIDVPILNGNASLAVIWPESRAFPWTNFAATPTPSQDPRTDEALRRFRKFVISFRSHSKGSLKRLAAKIEHERMTKGTGQAVLDYMISKGILTRGAMYTLIPDKLSAETGASYTSCMARSFSKQTIAFVQSAIRL